jgi:FHS family glucose/mannose:H+ symporter-like MFS transporter
VDSSSQPVARHRIVTALLHLGFVLTGIFMVLLGPALPALVQRWGLNDSQAGLFFAAQFLGSVLSGFLSGLLIPRFGFRPAFVSGLALMAAGAAFFLHGSWLLALLAVFVFGFGAGFMNAGTNLWIGQAYVSGASGALSFVNFSWAVGAVACPLIVQFMQSVARFHELLISLAVAAALLSAVFAATPVDLVELRNADIDSASTVPIKIPRDYYAVALIILLFLYEGAETSLGGWLAMYSRELSSVDRLRAGVVAPSFFWAGMMLGRLAGPAILRKISSKPVVEASVGCALLSSILLLRSPSLIPLFGEALVAGLGCALVYPILVARAIERYGVAARTVVGPMLAISGFGPASMPWLVGVIASHVGDLKAGLGVVLVALITILGGLRFVYGDASLKPSPNSPARE